MALRPLRSLYVCYFPLTEPLVETQVRAYLRGLAAAGHEIHLLTFELARLDRQERSRWRALLSEEGIAWHGLRYHKRFSLLATAWDVLVGIVVATFVVRRHRLDIVHVRTHVPGAMGLAVRRLTGCGLLFDVRGLMAEEYVDAGTWVRGGLPYRLITWVQRRCIAVADGVVVLTERARQLLFDAASVTASGAPVAVIPSCVDVEAVVAQRSARDEVRARLGFGPEHRVLVYVGKFSTWYMAREMAAFAAVAMRNDSSWRFLVLTQSDPALITDELDAAGVPRDAVVVTRSEPGEVGAYLASADAAISFITASPSKIASSPTKIGEYLAAGLPVVTAAGVGDVDALLTGAGVGVIVDDHSEPAYERALGALTDLSQDPSTPARCTETARTALSLVDVGVPRYRHLYTEIGRRRLVPTSLEA